MNFTCLVRVCLWLAVYSFNETLRHNFWWSCSLCCETFQQAYNTQVGVDSQAQIIVAAKVTQSGADQEQLIPVLREVR